jgi:hypothetical protein
VKFVVHVAPGCWTCVPAHHGTGIWTIVAALATVVGSAVVLIGAVVAFRYGQKANLSIEATPYLQDDGLVVLVVRPSISSPGVRPILISDVEDHAPVVSVLEYLRGPGGLYGGKTFPGNRVFSGETVGGGETVTKVDYFILPVQTPGLIGWRTTFFVDVPRRWNWIRKLSGRREEWWSWTAEVFVRVPDALPSPQS